MKVTRIISLQLKKASRHKQALVSSRFFKTKKGEYGEGDVFVGVTVPETRAIAKKFWKDASLAEVKKLLLSKVHEERLAALLILVEKFRHSGEEERKQIFAFNLANAKAVNNWDLVDCSADKIAGAFLYHRDWSALKKMAASESVWERRIAVIATFYFTRKKDPEKTFAIAELLFHDKHDLIQKAVGWMLREVGKNCSEEQLEEFLKENYEKIPRTTLRYAIERFRQEKRKRFLKGF